MPLRLEYDLLNLTAYKFLQIDIESHIVLLLEGLNFIFLEAAAQYHSSIFKVPFSLKQPHFAEHMAKKPSFF